MLSTCEILLPSSFPFLTKAGFDSLSNSQLIHILILKIEKQHSSGATQSDFLGAIVENTTSEQKCGADDVNRCSGRYVKFKISPVLSCGYPFRAGSYQPNSCTYTGDPDDVRLRRENAEPDEWLKNEDDYEVHKINRVENSHPRTNHVCCDYPHHDGEARPPTRCTGTKCCRGPVRSRPASESEFVCTLESHLRANAPTHRSPEREFDACDKQDSGSGGEMARARDGRFSAHRPRSPAPSY
ncbi:hypothetical protein B0H11DRAFT_1931296 [Mycena galericulata]|nr:hypothetical protein B0H11DRAFT_1931296 [Mycena galericulata]